MDIPFLSDILAWMQSLWDFLYSGVMTSSPTPLSC